MLDFEVIKQVLVVSIGASIISTALIQKIKEGLTSKKHLAFISCIISLLVGFTFSLVFSDLNYVYSIWVGICTYVGADALYKTFEEKLFTPFGKMNEVVEVPKNKIKTLDDIEKEV